MPLSTSEFAGALDLTGEIVSAYVAHNSLRSAELPALILIRACGVAEGRKRGGDADRGATRSANGSGDRPKVDHAGLYHLSG